MEKQEKEEDREEILKKKTNEDQIFLSIVSDNQKMQFFSYIVS